jgi:hypothetical protein
LPLPEFKSQFVKLVDSSIPFPQCFDIVQQNYATSANFLIHHVNSSAISANKTYALDKDWLGELTDDAYDGVAIWPTCLALRDHFLMCVV